jgi:hypothetical protein
LSLGFVWISLDSLVRNETYQWVTLEKPQKIFPIGFPLLEHLEQADPTVVTR